MVTSEVMVMATGETCDDDEGISPIWFVLGQKDRVGGIGVAI